jgi:DNA helicase-2/ATP-dependent DNA helicase PcrA
VDDYLTCPRKYKFIHITPIKMMTDPRVIFGRAIHKVIEEFYKSKIANHPLKIEELIDIYKQNWSSEGFISTEHEKQRFDEGAAVVKRFFNEFGDKLNIIEVEKPFKFEIENNIIEGRIDAIEKLENGGAGIIDFKTSEIEDQKKADARSRDNTQLGVYALAIKEIEGKLPEQVGLFFLMNGVVGRFVPTETSLEKVREGILRASNGIRAQEFKATPSQMDCENCPFSRYCDDSVV